MDQQRRSEPEGLSRKVDIESSYTALERRCKVLDQEVLDSNKINEQLKAQIEDLKNKRNEGEKQLMSQIRMLAQNCDILQKKLDDINWKRTCVSTSTQTQIDDLVGYAEILPRSPIKMKPRDAMVKVGSSHVGGETLNIEFLTPYLNEYKKIIRRLEQKVKEQTGLIELLKEKVSRRKAIAMSEISTTTGPYSTNLTLNSVLNGFSIKESLPQELSSANSRNSPNLKQKASDSRQRSSEAFEEQVMDMDLELSRNPDCSSVARIVIGNKSDPREQTRKTTSHIPFTDNSLRAPLSRSQSVIQAQNTELSDRHFEKSQMGRSGQPFAAGDFMRQNQKPATKQNPVLVGSERHLSQVEYWNVGKILLCPTCNGNFTGEPEIIFFEHVNACADTAEEEPEENVQYGSLVPVTDDMLRICPMCEAKFDNTVPQADFENHVQNHFNDEFLEVNGFVNVDQ